MAMQRNVWTKYDLSERLLILCFNTALLEGLISGKSAYRQINHENTNTRYSLKHSLSVVLI